MKKFLISLILSLALVANVQGQLKLKQSTAKVITFGPMLDKSDGVSEEVGLVSALDNGTTGIKLSKNGAAFAVRHATVTASTYDANGNYLVTLDATDTGTLGALRVQYTDSATCLPYWKDYEVLPANVYDSIILGSDYLQVDAVQAVGVTPASLAEVRTEVDTALTAINLDHLVGTATGIPALPAGTYLDLALRDGTATYDRTTDSLQAIRDRGDTAWGGAGSADWSPTEREMIRSALGVTGTKTTATGGQLQDIHDTDLPAVKTDTAAIKVQTDKLAFTVTNQIDANVIDWKGAAAPAMSGDAYSIVNNGTYGNSAIKTQLADVHDTDLPAVKTDTAAVKVKTDYLPSATAGTANGVFIAGANAPTTGLTKTIKKNQATNNFLFFMKLSSDHRTGATGKSITCTRSIDGAAFAACANAATEVSGGWYKISFAASDLNGNTNVAVVFSSFGCDDTPLTIILEP